MVQQSSRGHSPDEVALFACQHAGQHVARDVDMGHHIDLPDALPVVVLSLWSAAHTDARVRAEDVDATVRLVHLLDQSHDVSLARDVALDRGRTDFLGQPPRAITVDVHHDDGLCTVRRESPGECPTDAASGPGHDADLAVHDHCKL